MNRIAFINQYWRRFLDSVVGYAKGVAVALAVTGLLFVFSIPGAVASVKLNDPMAGNADVFAIDSTSSRVVYLADQDIAGVKELYSVPIDGSASPTKLHTALSAGQEVGSFAIAENGTFVVFRLDLDIAGTIFELYKVPITGGTPAKLNGSLPTGGNVTEFAISPNGNYVVYLADQVYDDVFELYSVDISGAPGTPQKLNTDLSSGSLDDVLTDFAINNESSFVAYRVGDGIGSRIDNLYKVDITGGTPVQLNPTLAAGQSVSSFKISAYVVDKNYVVFRINAYNAGGGNQIYCYGSGYADLSPGVGSAEDFKISPNGQRVVFRYEATVGTDNFQLYSVPTWGGGATLLNDWLGLGKSVRADIVVSPSSSLVIYRADPSQPRVIELFSVPIDGGVSPTKLNLALFGEEDILDSFIVSADDNWVVYRAGVEANETDQLYSVPSGGGDSAKLSGSMQTTGNVKKFMAISNDSKTVVFIADRTQEGQFELFGTPIAGGDPIKLNGTLVEGADVQDFALSPDSTRVVYKADQDTDMTDELYSTLLEIQEENSYLLWTK